MKLLTFLVNDRDRGYVMYDVDANVVEETFKPAVELNGSQVGLYERTDTDDGGCLYIFRMRTYIEEGFNEGDYIPLFDYLTDFFYHQTGDEYEE